MDSKDNNINIQYGNAIKNRRRGDILYYSVSQVAALLGEEDSNIRYYTNVFDNILKIEIENKELRYTIRDIDKLDFLINLKNKGMTVKQIQKYCEELPLDSEDSTNLKETDSVSFEEIITSLTTSENKQIDDLLEHLTNKIDSLNETIINKVDENYKLAIQKINDNNELTAKKIDDMKEYVCKNINKDNESSIKKIIELIIDEQNKQFNLFKENMLNEIKEYIDYRFDSEYKKNSSLYNKCSDIHDLISDNFSLENSVKLELDKFNEACMSRDKNLLNEFKKFKTVIEQAYYIQQEVDTQKKHVSFIEKLFSYKQ